MQTTGHLCTHIIKLLHAPIHVYDAEGNQTAVYVDYGEQQDIFACDQKLLATLLEKGQKEAPVLHLEMEEIIYGVVCDRENIYLLGPCCVGRDPIAAARQLVHRHRMNPEKPYRVSSASIYDFIELMLILHERLNDDEIESGEVLMRSFCNQYFEQAMREKVHRVFYALRESAVIHNPYDQELREQESIRTGDLEALHRSFAESYVGKTGTLSPDPLRNAKNLIIVIITLASRSAIAGGMLPEIAFSMSDAFIQRVEELKNQGEVLALGRQAEIEYCTAVRDLSFDAGRSTLVTRCKALIIQELYSRLSVKELARRLEISPDYLSRLFVREEGIKLTDYITREKINAAKRHLAYTDDTYDTLAFSLGFSSQSHFGQAFKKWMGVTPRQYREQYGKQL
ncbi:MAG: helix-turn-helix domain-containing protein [Blautia sp.]|nr:helix-turn-helix domain-containing protein [Blautia sp.]MCM1201495.1 helix-turn-helix domain-containing protein [Bacteroides fragilis]